jgi:HEAT repeat protein
MRRVATSVTIILMMTGAVLSFAIGQDIEGLVKGLEDPNAGVRAMAGFSLAQKGPNAVAAVPALSRALTDQDLNVRYSAANALRAIGPGAEAAVPALIKALETFPGGSPPLTGPHRYYADARWIAADALGAIGIGAREAVPALTKTLSDPDPNVRRAAASALKRITGKWRSTSRLEPVYQRRLQEFAERIPSHPTWRCVF